MRLTILLPRNGLQISFVIDIAIYLQVVRTTLSLADSLRKEGKVAWLETPNGLDATACSAGTQAHVKTNYANADVLV